MGNITAATTVHPTSSGKEVSTRGNLDRLSVV